ncbi:hypothetical protein T07_14193 [Trichinella nelsoni]|uniref:Uncharacterized protein n=1 Tax=Trichinella nelsoni TaxID=6336 RepID=A0A0V0RIL5_9BILA|nr:hypothetical protein T07_14193 [Trichinella nelsoni]
MYAMLQFLAHICLSYNDKHRATFLTFLLRFQLCSICTREETTSIRRLMVSRKAVQSLSLELIFQFPLNKRNPQMVQLQECPFLSFVTWSPSLVISLLSGVTDRCNGPHNS